MIALVGVLLVAAPATKEVVVDTEVRLSSWFKSEKDAAKKEKYRQEAFGRGLEEARKLATRQALKDAVASLAPGPAADSLMAEERIFSRLDELVREDSTDEKHTDESLTLTLHATVQTGAIDKELAEIRGKMTRLGQKKVLLAVGEVTLGTDGKPVEEGARRVLSTTLADMLRRDGWVIYDGAGHYQTGDASREEIDRVGQELGVDEVLAGTATIQRFAPNNSTFMPSMNERGQQILFFVSGSYALELVDAGTWIKRATVAGKMAQSKMNGVQASQSYAATELEFVKVTSPPVAAELREKWLVALDQMVQNGTEVSVVMHEVDLAQVAAFETVLKKISGVKQVAERGDYVDQTQTVEARFTGTANELATAISKAKGHKFAVTSVKKALIELSPK